MVAARIYVYTHAQSAAASRDKRRIVNTDVQSAAASAQPYVSLSPSAGAQRVLTGEQFGREVKEGALPRSGLRCLYVKSKKGRAELVSTR